VSQDGPCRWPALSCLWGLTPHLQYDAPRPKRTNIVVADMKYACSQTVTALRSSKQALTTPDSVASPHHHGSTTRSTPNSDIPGCAVF
jgi:hypothetical protein